MLSNGLTVASQDMFGQMSSFALIASVGSAYELQDVQNSQIGSTQMMELLAFRSTHKKTHQDIMTEIENIGGLVQCISNRETILYCVDVMRENIEPAMDILADTILNPRILEEEIEETKQIIQFQHAEIPPEFLSRDTVQRAAYLNSPLGNFHYCPLNRIGDITQKQIVNFRDKYIFGQNCMLSGAGIDHDTFVSLAQDKFRHLPQFSKLRTGDETCNLVLPSKYTGGMIAEQRELKDHFVRVAVGFEIGGWHDKDLVVVCVLHQLLGGGSSFSAGGPGKGMYTRLYTDVLNRYHWVESAEAFTSIHEQTGILGIALKT